MKLCLLPLTADRRRFLLNHPYRIAAYPVTIAQRCWRRGSMPKDRFAAGPAGFEANMVSPAYPSQLYRNMYSAVQRRATPTPSSIC